MSTSIYNIQNWQGGINFNEHDIVNRNNYFYYAKSIHTSSSNFDTDNNNGLWGGINTDDNGQTKPIFIWKPSYSNQLQFEPKIKQIKFGEGYEQRMKDGINNNLLKLQLKFNNRKLHEYTAIQHFLNSRQGYESFLYIPLPPFNTRKKFKCLIWNAIDEFYDNFNLEATFEEVVN
jgi:phage-related protein